MSTRVTAVVKQVPRYSRETKDILPLLKTWLYDQDERYQRKAKKIFENANVDKRYSIMDPNEVFHATSFEDKNNIYKK